MPKTLVFCADGTWNGPGQTTVQDGHPPEATAAGTPPTAGECASAGCTADLTNVCKLFGWLQGDFEAGTAWGGDEMEKRLVDADGRTVQVAKYIHGVGNSQQLIDKVGGGSFGVGVTARIARGYTFLSREYEPGDRIVIVGFSRGAYTARALAGLVAGEGLLKPELARADDPTRYDTAAAAWFRWRHGKATTFQKIVDYVTELTQLHGAFKHAKDLHDDSFVPVTIAAVAVWDTVGALGIPVYLDGHSVDLFRFCDTKLSDKVAVGLHAVALDERRDPFQPTLWDPAPNVTQALFPGGHCDIGGGYAEHGLSDIALLWTVDRLQHADIGVRFDTHPPVDVTPDPMGDRHGAWIDQPFWAAAGLHARVFPAGTVVNDAVRQRINGAEERLRGSPPPAARYSPANLPS